MKNNDSPTTAQMQTPSSLSLSSLLPENDSTIPSLSSSLAQQPVIGISGTLEHGFFGGSNGNQNDSHGGFSLDHIPSFSQNSQLTQINILTLPQNSTNGNISDAHTNLNRPSNEDNDAMNFLDSVGGIRDSNDGNTVASLLSEFQDTSNTILGNSGDSTAFFGDSQSIFHNTQYVSHMGSLGASNPLDSHILSLGINGSANMGLSNPAVTGYNNGKVTITDLGPDGKFDESSANQKDISQPPFTGPHPLQEEDEEGDSSPIMVSMGTLVNKYISTDANYGLPTNTIYFSPESRQLLHHYIHQVSRLMTVVTHDSTPWKTIYLPRAINAIGCLTALGVASPARSTILHALLSVSSYHLASKYPENSDQRKHYTNFGLRLKTHAQKYLKQCPSRPNVDSVHKDITTAVLSMVTIEVVSGEMDSCTKHLNSCKELILSQVRNGQMVDSKETQILHRIYAFLNLLQDSTNITPDRLDSSVLDDSEWNYIREMKDLGLESPSDDTPQLSPASATSSSPSDPTNRSRVNVSPRGNPAFLGPLASHISSGVSRDNILGEFEFFGNNECADASWMWDHNAASPTTSLLNTALQNPSPNNKTFLSASQPVKNYYDAEIVSTYAMYGIPDSLTILFNRVVRLARQRCYIKTVGETPPKLLKAFNNKCARMDSLLLEWLTKFQENQIPPEFTADSKMAFYLHTIAFYHSLWIYHCTIVKDVPSETLQDKVKLVLRYLQNMLQLNRDRPSPVIVPLLFPAFIAACETVYNELAEEFETWFSQMIIDGLGTYCQARMIVHEVWKRRRLGQPNCRWYEIMQEWNINLLLS